MTNPVTAPKWQQEVLSWAHAMVAGGLGALAGALDVAGPANVLTFRNLAHAVAVGAAVRGVGWLLARWGP